MEQEAKDEIAARLSTHIIKYMAKELLEDAKTADAVEIMGMVFATLVIYWWQERQGG